MNEQDKRVRDYYANLSLPVDKLDQLIRSSHVDEVNSAQKSAEPAVNKTMSMPSWPTAFKSIAACALIMMVSLWMHNTGTESERMQQTVREVAMNHTTRLEPEYRGETLASLDNSMQQLPFALVLPKALDSAYELIGSRYCSLGGSLAAHVKFKEKESGKHMSLFVTGNSNELEEIRANQTTHEGVAVEFWREDGLFFALAKRT